MDINDPLPVPGNINDLVAFQEGHIGQYEPVRGDGGRAVWYAFDRGRGLSDHAALGEVMLFVQEGSLEVITGAGTRKMASGDVLHIPAECRFSLTAKERSRLLLVMLGEVERALDGEPVV